jgi:hypothetical protein
MMPSIVPGNSDGEDDELKRPVVSLKDGLPVKWVVSIALLISAKVFKPNRTFKSENMMTDLQFHKLKGQ